MHNADTRRRVLEWLRLGNAQARADVGQPQTLEEFAKVVGVSVNTIDKWRRAWIGQGVLAKRGERLTLPKGKSLEETIAIEQREIAPRPVVVPDRQLGVVSDSSLSSLVESGLALIKRSIEEDNDTKALATLFAMPAVKALVDAQTAQATRKFGDLDDDGLALEILAWVTDRQLRDEVVRRGFDAWAVG